MKTSKLVALTLFLGFVSLNTTAQVYSFGPKAGVVFSNFADHDVEAREGLQGVVGGVFFEYRSEGLLSFQPELLFAQMGSKLDYSGDFGNLRVRANYIQLPLLLKLNLPLPLLNPYVYGGGYGSALVNSEFKGEFGPRDFNRNDLDLKPFDAGAILGMGVNIEVGALLLGAEYRYGIGLLDINDYDGYFSRNVEAENRTHYFMVNLGIVL